MATLTQTDRGTVQPILPAKWQPEQTFTSDELINAYIVGKIAGKEEYKQKLMKDLEANLMRAAITL